jgi:predicted ABC-type ATPase
MPRPLLTVIAGPNGSGKSTLTQKLLSRGIDLGHYVNADEIELGLSHIKDAQLRSKEAQRLADSERTDCLAKKRDFAFETVMSHPSKIDLMKEARQAGYQIILYFVALDNPELNVARVDLRVARGGHPVPKDRIIARYHRTLALLPSAILEADRIIMFDNTNGTLSGLQVVAEIKRLQNSLRFEIRDLDCWWLNRRLLDHLLLNGLSTDFKRIVNVPIQTMQAVANACILDMTFP